MKNFELIHLLKLFLNGIKIFPITPVIITRNQTIKISRKLKYIYIALFIPTSFYLLHYYLLIREPGELRADPYLFLGFARGFISSALPCSATAVLIINSDYIEKSLHILVNLHKKLQISQRKLNLAFWIILLELGYLYLGCGIWGFIIYSHKMKNLAYRIGITVVNSVIMVTIIASDLFYFNLIILIREYLDLINKKLESYKSTKENFKWAYEINIERHKKYENIKNIRKIYQDIYDAKELIQKYFSWPLLMSTSLVFFDIVFFAFLTLVRSQIGVTIITIKELLCVRFSCYGLIARLIIMVMVTDMMGRKMKKTGLILADLSNKVDDFMEKREVVEEFMEEFFLMDPTITASGFVSVDYGLLKGILGTITVYTIILLQFKLGLGSSNPIASLMYYY